MQYPSRCDLLPHTTHSLPSSIFEHSTQYELPLRLLPGNRSLHTLQVVEYPLLRDQPCSWFNGRIVWLKRGEIKARGGAPMADSNGGDFRKQLSFDILKPL